MCSIGNTAFNSVWEASLPAETVLPQHHPDISAVREAFIVAKYQDHAFFKNEATPAGAVDCPPADPQERFPLGSSVTHEGDVTKLSGGRMFGGNKWDARQLRLQGCVLSYHAKGSEKGRVDPLRGCTATLCDDDEFAGHPNCFAVQTPVTGNDAKNDGRRYVFQAPSKKDAVKWLQMLRYALSDGNQSASSAAAELQQTDAASSPFGSTPGVPYCGLGQVVDSLYCNAEQWVETSTLKSGAAKQVGVPNNFFGQWHERFAVLTPWCLFVFARAGEWNHPTCSIPLQAAELVDNPRLLPMGQSGSEIPRVGVSYPLGFCVLSFPTAEETRAWGTALKEAIQTAQEQTGAAAT
mmetsp:Transcript_40245/g.81191  ORF Transcript_40245/g.81191 Transcript_40245/m.81191 type:complete len:351 (-) Transcript_40245:266-1318(-)